MSRTHVHHGCPIRAEGSAPDRAAISGIAGDDVEDLCLVRFVNRTGPVRGNSRSAVPTRRALVGGRLRPPLRAVIVHVHQTNVVMLVISGAHHWRDLLICGHTNGGLGS
jgi:hypothetical protein